jgi:hypothetical protein
MRASGPLFLLPRLGRRTATVALSLAAVAAAVAIPTTATATTTAPGSQYAVSFSGTGSEDLHWAAPEIPWSGEQSGTWTLRDTASLGAGRVWLPSASNPAEESATDFATAYAPGWLGGSGPVAEPASLAETGIGPANDSDNPVSYSCSSSSINDNGTAQVSAGVALGSLSVATAYMDRDLTDTWDEGLWTCSDNELDFPPDFDYRPPGIEYAATVPFGDVGQASFTLPITDQSTVNPCASDEYHGGGGPTGTCTFEFGISGNYTFDKVCDGTIAYSGDTESGMCGGASAPDTRITHSTVSSSKGTASFKFTGSSGAGATLSFQCKLDKSAYKSCRSPKTYKRLKKGKHVFKVRAKDSSGTIDPTPAKKRFKI